MTSALEGSIFIWFLAFCRIGGCLMLVPGFGAARVPVPVRLLIALAISLALTPLLSPLYGKELTSTDVNRLRGAGIELVIGVFIGLCARLFVISAQFGATLTANLIGLAGIPGISADEGEALAPLASLVSLGATAVLFAAGLHLELLRALFDSYRAFPPGASLSTGDMLENFINAITVTILLGLRLASPFILYSVLVNVAIGLAGKFAPQLQVYFVATGVVMIGGLGLLWLVLPDWIMGFSTVYGNFLRDGAL